MNASTAVARRDTAPPAQASAALAIRPGQEMWTDKQKAALAVLGIKNASNGDLAVFMHYCQRTGLDPFSRQIYMICRRVKDGDQWVDKQTIQVGIDGFRVIRDRLAAKLGITVEYEDTVWYDAEGTPYDVWLWDYPPTACKVVVIKDGHRYPAVCRTASYMQTNKQGEPAGQWKTQPDHMIEKCCEAFGLRRAFPNDLGSIYIPEETADYGTEDTAAGRPARVTAAEVTRPRVQATVVRDEDDAPGGQPDDSAAPAGRRADRPTGAAVGKLGRLLTRVQLGTPEDVAVYLEWIGGAPTIEGLSREKVTTVTLHLENMLSAAGGDPAEAASAIWAAYRTAHPQDDYGDQDDADPDGSDG